jgi:diguanylate cyclase (GGDEF)-like protein
MKNVVEGELKILIEKFLDHKNDSSLKPLLDVCDELLECYYQCTTVVIFSAPVNHQEISKIRPDGWLRLIHGRKKLSNLRGIEDAVRKNWENKELSPKVETCALAQNQFVYLPLGSFDDQFLFALGKLPKEIKWEASTIDNYIVAFCQKSLSEVSRWREVSRYESLIYIDDVTLLFNQRKLVKDIDQAMNNYKQTQEPFAVLFIDIDHFKLVNDNHGHLIGTQLLADVAGVLRNLLRETDLCYRYGGDEFVVLVPDTDPDNARLIGERILKAITSKPFEIDESNLFTHLSEGVEKEALKKKEKLVFDLSVSVGVATCPGDAQGATEILALADRMMYEAKKSGRGQVCFAGEMFGKEA